MSFIRYLHLPYAIIDHLLFDIFIHYTFIMYLQVYTLQFPHLLHYIAHIFMASNRITIPPPSYCLLGPQADSQNDRYNAYARLSCALSLLNSRVLNKPLTCGVQALHTKRTYNINLPFYNAFTSCIRSGCYYSSAMK